MPSKNSSKPGSVIIFALLMLSLIAIVTDQLIRSTIIGSAFTKTMVDREHAEMLAFGGINIAIAQLTMGLEADANLQKTATADKDGRDQPADNKTVGDAVIANEFGKGADAQMKKFMHHLIAHLNRWQVFGLDQKIDGIQGTVGICISSEHGKINLNEAFDFKKQEFKKEYEALLKTLEIPGKIPLGELHNRLVEFLKKRGKKLYEVSELMGIAGLENLDVFYRPPNYPSRGKTAEPNVDLYLTDIFTMWTNDPTLDPLVFSDALCAIIGMRRPRADDPRRMKDLFKQFASAYKKDLGADWEGNWKILQPIFGEKPKVLPALKDILAKKFSSKVYSVLSYGKINNVEQRVLAIVKVMEEKSKKDDQKKDIAKDSDTKDKPPQGQPDQKESRRYFKVVRLYWL